MRESAAKAILRGVRALGHQSVEIREDGKQFIFFCTICLTPCYSDSALFDHLGGNLHLRRYSSAKLTLLGSNPWPFNDGVLFFHDLDEQEKQLAITNGVGHKCNANTVQLFLANHQPDSSAEDNALQLALSNQERSFNVSGDLFPVLDSLAQIACLGDANLQTDLNGNDNKLKTIEHEEIGSLVISGVLHKEELSSLCVRFLGYGGINIRASKGDGINKIWCSWLGPDITSDMDGDVTVPDCDFAVVIFPYSDNLGREGIGSDLNILCISDGGIKNTGKTEIKRKVSYGGPNGIPGFPIGSFGNGRVVVESSSNEALCLRGNESSIVLSSNGCVDGIQQERVFSNKALRKELRKRQRLASERLCGICQQKMLRGKDVATLLNKKTENFACSSRNTHGAFHVFHISCLIHWILFCESKVWHCSKSSSRRLNTISKEQVAVECGGGQTLKGNSTFSTISSVLCPECQGTGLKIEDELEVPRIPLSEMFICLINTIQSERAWMDHPEVLNKCSTGLYFQCGLKENVQGIVLPRKLLYFYRADG